MQLTKVPREFGSVRRIFVEGFMLFSFMKSFTCYSLYNIIDNNRIVFSSSQLSGHVYLFFMPLKIIVLFDTELKYSIQCTEADWCGRHCREKRRPRQVPLRPCSNARDISVVSNAIETMDNEMICFIIFCLNCFRHGRNTTYELGLRILSMSKEK